MRPDIRPRQAMARTGRLKGAGSLKNAGYTVLEMMVVVAILAVGLTIVGFSINAIFSLEMKQCTNNIGSELGKEKVACMTRTGEVYMHLYKTNGGIYIDKYENDTLIESGIKVGTVKVTVKYYSASNSAGTLLDGNGIVISFNKDNGSFKNIGQAMTLYNASSSPMYPNEYYSKLIISGGSISRTIVLWPDTGKFSITG